MIHRPRLPPRAQRVLSEFVTDHLLQALATRTDLDPTVTLRLRSALGRLKSPPAFAWVPGNPPAAEDWTTPRSQASTATDDASRLEREHARQLNQAGKLDDEVILSALRRNATAEVVAAMLAVKADLPVSVIKRACELRSASGIVSLAWKAGLSPETSVVLQATLANLPADMVLRPEQTGIYSLGDNEMRSQLSFLGAEERGTRAWVPRRLAQ